MGVVRVNRSESIERLACEEFIRVWLGGLTKCICVRLEEVLRVGEVYCSGLLMFI